MTCTWTKRAWQPYEDVESCDTGCSNFWYFGGKAQIDMKEYMRFCCYCGEPLVFASEKKEDKK